MAGPILPTTERVHGEPQAPCPPLGSVVRAPVSGSGNSDEA